MSTDTTQAGIDLDAIEARERVATEGPWTVDGLYIQAGGGCIADLDWHAEDEEQLAAIQADAAFIANARADVPGLLAEVKRLKAEATKATRWEVRLAETLHYAQLNEGSLSVEVEQLTKELAEMTGHRDAYLRDRDRWHAENARLRVALEEVAHRTTQRDLSEVAKAALAGQPQEATS